MEEFNAVLNIIQKIETSIDELFEENRITVEQAYLAYYDLAKICVKCGFQNEWPRLIKKFVKFCEFYISDRLKKGVMTKESAWRCYFLLAAECKEWGLVEKQKEILNKIDWKQFTLQNHPDLLAPFKKFGPFAEKDKKE